MLAPRGEVLGARRRVMLGWGESGGRSSTSPGGLRPESRTLLLSSWGPEVRVFCLPCGQAVLATLWSQVCLLPGC